jgi:dihydrofolate reductase
LQPVWRIQYLSPRLCANLELRANLEYRGKNVDRKVVLYVASSLDGYIARPDGDVSWLDAGQDYGYQAFYDTVDAVLMGRKTYEQVLSFGEPFPYRGKRCWVVTSKRSGRAGDVEFIGAEAIRPLIEGLKREEGRNIWLVGGAELICACYEADLIDEYILFTQPILLGDGIPLFLRSGREQALELAEVKRHPSGMLEARYRRKPAGDEARR